MIRKFRKKPVIIEAIEYTGNNLMEVVKFCEGDSYMEDRELIISTLEDGRTNKAVHIADIGDFIIKGVEGEFYPIKKNILIKTYEEVFDQEL